MRTVHMIALFEDDGPGNTGTFKRFTMNVPHGVDPLDYEDPEDTNGEKSEWGRPDYAGCIVEHDPDTGFNALTATRLIDKLKAS